MKKDSSFPYIKIGPKRKRKEARLLIMSRLAKIVIYYDYYHFLNFVSLQLIKRSASQRSQGTTLKILPLMRTRTSPVMQNGSLNQTPGDLPGDCHGATHKRPLRAKMFLKKILRKACGTFSGAAHSSCDNLHVL